MSIRSSMSDIPQGEYERIFGKKDRKIEYVDSPMAHAESIKPAKKDEPGVLFINEDGKKQDRLSAYQKNKLYKVAKDIKAGLSSTLCTRSECWDPNSKNVQKMLHNEMRNPQVQQFKAAMSAIGADPRDCCTERLRRR